MKTMALQFAGFAESHFLLFKTMKMMVKIIKQKKLKDKRIVNRKITLNIVKVAASHNLIDCTQLKIFQEVGMA
jgi:hypothetical protein